MVIVSSGSSNSAASCCFGGSGCGTAALQPPPPAAAAEPPRVQREPLKKRRGLSAFYASKSQSFSSIQELVSNPWSRSTLALAKRRPAWRRAGSPPPPSSHCIDEEGASDSSVGDAPAELQLQLLPAAAAPGSRRTSLERRSWDASDSASSNSSSSACSPLCGPAAAALQAQQLLQLAPWGQAQQQAAGPLLHDGAACACVPAADAWAAADGLCVALQGASLAAPLAGFALAGLCSYSCDTCSSMVVVGADDGC